MPAVPAELAQAHERFAALVGDLRPELHRYCSRLVGSAIDGEDVVQESLAKAFYALSLSPEVPPLKSWLLRIAHNTAIDFLRRYERRFVEPVADPPEIGSPHRRRGTDREYLHVGYLPDEEASAAIQAAPFFRPFGDYLKTVCIKPPRSTWLDRVSGTEDAR